MVDRDGRKIRAMFGAIAPTYDFLNHLLSFSADRYWRRVTRKELEARLEPCGRALDLCTGTADLALEMARIGPVTACDFSRPMLMQGMHKVQRRETANPILFVQGDALALPFPSRTFEVATIAFGLRNLEDYGRGLGEVARVLRAGGYLAVLEFAAPDSRIFGALYRIYFERLLPVIGGLISGRVAPYRYLPESVKGFPPRVELEGLFVDAGFSTPDSLRLSAGIAEIYIAQRQ